MNYDHSIKFVIMDQELTIFDLKSAQNFTPLKDFKSFTTDNNYITFQFAFYKIKLRLTKKGKKDNYDIYEISSCI